MAWLFKQGKTQINMRQRFGNLRHICGFFAKQDKDISLRPFGWYGSNKIALFKYQGSNSRHEISPNSLNLPLWRDT